ncbi:phytolongin Phyl1.2-like [Hordeum vulgare subsp. vulgare]|uniref:Longin domain-containing protein n=1 Tax=Hordeum vulgare subsp. vulgare TaxID=112509 RepID=A0A287LXT3_HORVV|nr:phytolongin Phyl1.2-like [Hordeum vulgare subsp. vulgare]
MIFRRSNPRGFVVHRLEPMKEAIAGASEGDGVESNVFFCVAVTSRGKKDRLSYFRSSDVGDDEEAACALAALCLDHAPEHHRWHHHTYDGRRTFAVLAADDGRTYLAVAEPTPGSAEVIRFLERVRDACSEVPRRRQRDEAVSRLVRQFEQTLQAGPSSSAAANSVVLPGDGSWSEHASDKDEEAQPDEGAPRRRPARSSWRRTLWRRHAMAVIGVDVVLCLVLFGVWMAVCHGFSCVQR